MCELNYRGTKIEIGVKLRDQKCNFTYKKWSIYREPLRRWHLALTRDNQRLRLTVNVQIGLPGPILQGFIKLGDQICELNYKGIKSVIGDKVGDQFYNFALNYLHKAKPKFTAQIFKCKSSYFQAQFNPRNGITDPSLFVTKLNIFFLDF